MTDRRSPGRILTTHTGSLPRPPDLVAMLREREEGRPPDEAAFQALVRQAVALNGSGKSKPARKGKS